MNIVELQRKLIAVARANPPGDRVPYAFEKRVMACLAARRALDRGAFWVRALWRGAAACGLIRDPVIAINRLHCVFHNLADILARSSVMLL